jgi:hypothetical protein
MPAPLVLVTTASLVASGAISPGEGTPKDTIRNAVVKVIAVVREPNPIRPWIKGPAHELTGSGAVIRGNRILTAAHLVLHAGPVSVQPEKSGEKLTATVEATGPGIDLAIL